SPGSSLLDGAGSCGLPRAHLGHGSFRNLLSAIPATKTEYHSHPLPAASRTRRTIPRNLHRKGFRALESSAGPGAESIGSPCQRRSRDSAFQRRIGAIDWHHLIHRQPAALGLEPKRHCEHAARGRLCSQLSSSCRVGRRGMSEPAVHSHLNDQESRVLDGCAKPGCTKLGHAALFEVWLLRYAIL